MPTAELPVAWWAFWLVAMAALVFIGFCWWLLRAALREDHAPESEGPGGESGATTGSPPAAREALE